MPVERRRRGRPRLFACGVESVTIALPVTLYDRFAREALQRDIPIAAVVREVVLRQTETAR